MESSEEIKATSESDVTPPVEQIVDFKEDTLRAEVEDYKDKGNDEYRKRHFSKAIYFYTEGIKLNLEDKELMAKLYSNRAIAHFYLGNFCDTLSDAKAANNLQPSYVKAIERGASACVKLNLFEEAITWCDKGLAIDNENTTLVQLKKKSLTRADEKGSSSETKAMDAKPSRGEECKTAAVHNRSAQRNVYIGLGVTAFKRGDLKTARQYFELELSDAKDERDKSREGDACVYLGAVYGLLSDFKTAIGFYQQTLGIAKEAGNKNLEGKVYTRLGASYYYLNDFKKAIEYHQQALSIAKEAGCKDAEGNAYTNLGNAHYSIGDFKTAIEFQQQALGITKEVGNKDAEGAANSNLGVAYWSLGDFKRAFECHQQALIISQETGNKITEGLEYINLGLAHYSLGDSKTAIQFYQQGLSIAKEVGNKDSEGKAYTNLGMAYYALDDFKTAIDFHERALNISKELGDKNSEGKVRINLGLAYRSLYDFKTAIEFYQQSLSIAKEAGNRDLEGKAYTNLGAAYHSLGAFKKAMEFHQQALRIAEESGNNDSKGLVYMDIGVGYYSLGDLKKAIEFYRQALSTAKEIGNKDLEGKAYTNLGDAYHNFGDFQTAIKFFQQALRIAKKAGNKDTEGYLWMNLGVDYHSQGDIEKAIEFHQQALGSAKAAGNKDLEMMVCGNLASAFDTLGDFEKAIEFQQQALSIAKETRNKDREGKVYGNLGLIYHQLGDIEKAIEFFQQAVSIAKENGNRLTEGEVYANLGCAYSSLGDFSKAEEFFNLSVTLFDEIRSLLQSKDEWKIGLRNQYQTSYSNLWRVQLLQNKTIEALFTAERGRAQALMDLLELQYGVKSARPESGEQKEAMSSISSYIPSLVIFLAEAPDLVNFWVLKTGQQCEFMKKEINNSLESLTQETYKQIGVFNSVMCENRSLDGPIDEEFEEMLSRSPGEKPLTPSKGEGNALKALSDILVGPISHFLHGDEVILIPDGQLLLVPYAALLDQHSRYLSEMFRIRLVPSLTSLKLMAQCPGEERHCTSDALLVGDPWVETVRVKGKRVIQLPSAKKEVEMIGTILKIEPLTGKNATKAEVLSRLNSVALVHIAAHGCAETGEIVLSPNPASSKRPKEEDFLLTMADVLNAKLQAKLVVLSCCHSGRGKIKAEGVVGIARAFLGAGARSVIASLWAIDDDATLEFVRKFYEHLLEGKSASKSLNESMKWMQKSDNFSAEKYWAPFVLIGDDVRFNFGQSSNFTATQQEGAAHESCSCM